MRLLAVIAVLLVYGPSLTAWAQPLISAPPFANAPVPLIPSPLGAPLQSAPGFVAPGGFGSPGLVNPGLANPGFGSPSFGSPGFGSPGLVAPGLGSPGFAPIPNQGAFLSGTVQPLDPYALPSNGAALPPAPGGLPGLLPALPGTTGAPFGFSQPGLLPPGVSPNWQSSPAAPGLLPTLPPNAANSFGGAAGINPPGGNLPPLSNSPYGQPTARTRPQAGLRNNGLNQNRSPYYRNSPYPRMGDGYFRQNYGGNPYGYGRGQQGGYGYRNPSSQYGNLPYPRLFQNTGLRGTYIHGDGGENEMSLVEAEASTTAYFPNFLGVPNGLRVTPGFVFHWTSGPLKAGDIDVPPRLYSGYLDFGLNPRFSPQFSAELTARVGIYSDFQAFNNDALRYLGSAVGVFQTTPDVALKLGAVYIDRVEVKLLPAIGLLWTPNPYTYWDIFFPAPKISNYWTTMGNQQVWWYAGGEYGGGSWSIETRGGDETRIDINDIRAYLGVEWFNLNRYYGFAEIGYVFAREVVFDEFSEEDVDLDDSFMIRAGVSW